MKHLCYIILAHNNLELLSYQIKLLSGKDISFIIHIDAKCMEPQAHIKSIPNVIIAETHNNVEWGGFSMVQTTFSLCEEALRKLPDADYFILLSGQCFPVKNAQYIKDYISKKGDKNYLCAQPIPSQYCTWLEGGRRRLECYAVRLAPREIATIEPRKLNYGNLRQICKTFLRGNLRSIITMARILLFAPKRKPLGIPAYGGEYWWRMNRESIETIIKYYNQNSDFKHQMSITSNPDEIAFNSLCFHFCNNTEISLLTYINWKGETNSPDYITMQDKTLLDSILKEQNTLFCRKVKDTTVINYISSQIGND